MNELVSQALNSAAKWAAGAGAKKVTSMIVNRFTTRNSRGMQSQVGVTHMGSYYQDMYGGAYFCDPYGQWYAQSPYGGMTPARPASGAYPVAHFYQDHNGNQYMQTGQGRFVFDPYRGWMPF